MASAWASTPIIQKPADLPITHFVILGAAEPTASQLLVFLEPSPLLELRRPTAVCDNVSNPALIWSHRPRRGYLDKGRRTRVSKLAVTPARRAAHHTKSAQPRALKRKASDEFTVPLCRVYHQDLHRTGSERAGTYTAAPPKHRTLSTDASAILSDIAPKSAIQWLPAVDLIELSWEIGRYRMLRHKS